jgi:hypothetical protein
LNHLAHHVPGVTADVIKLKIKRFWYTHEPNG